MSKPIIAVVGGTGAQGGGVVNALLERGRFAVRVLTRNPASDRAKALAGRGIEVVTADLNDASTLPAAFEGAYGAFVVTNFFDAATASSGSGGRTEAEQGAAAVSAAREAGVQHFVWSTLPNVDRLSEGELAVHHFTGKAVVDQVVTDAGFAFHTFVEPPMYFQNFLGNMKPKPLGNGATGWGVPMDPAAPALHMGDVTEVGKVVARAFEEPELVGQGQHLGVAADLLSWNDIVATLEAQGHQVAVQQIPPEVYDGFYPGARELRETMQWFEGYTYYGPEADRKLANTRSIYAETITGFSEWAARNLPAQWSA
ncbi:MAG: hypothetical protein ACI8RZ_003194 [Myxococcota bacterium]|jgi:uncharacterized protein YbjT (DUF2867 family)